MSNQAAYLAIGRIVGPHGVRGEVKVKVLTDFPERFDVGSRLLLEGESARREVLSARPHKGMLLVKFSGVADRNAVAALRGKYLFVPREEAMPLGKDEFYEDELVGLRVETMTGESLGEVADVMWTGANEVYVVRGAKGEWLLPAIADVIQSVDVDAGVMRVTLLPGLLDEM